MSKEEIIEALEASKTGCEMADLSIQDEIDELKNE